MSEKQRLLEVVNLEASDDKRLEQPRNRFIKLNNGEDIACQVYGNDESVSFVIVKDPMKVTLIVHRNSGSASFGFSRWIPFTDQRFVAISKLSIIAIANLSAEASVLYAGCQATFDDVVTEESEVKPVVEKYVPPKYLN